LVMAATSAWMPGACTDAAAGVVTGVVGLVGATDMADGERLADGPKRLAILAVVELEDDAGVVFSD